MCEDEQKRVKQLTLKLEEATGLDNFKAVVEKAERYQETKDTLNELRRNSQQKLLQLYQKRDQLSEQQKNLNLAETDPKKLQEMYDEKEKLVIKIETEIDELKEQMEKRRRLEAEIEFCISNLGTRLGIKSSESDLKSPLSKSDRLIDMLNLCGDKVRELKRQNLGKGSLYSGSENEMPNREGMSDMEQFMRNTSSGQGNFFRESRAGSIY